MIKIIFLLFFLFHKIHGKPESPIVILSLTGLSTGLKTLPTKIQELRAKGIAGRINSFFPVENKPIEFSIATGLDPNKHGVVGDQIQIENDHILTDNDEELFRYNPENYPLWSIPNIRAYCLGWSGSLFEFNSRLCNQLEVKATDAEYFNDAVQKLKNKQADLMMISFDFAHILYLHSIDSEEVKGKLDVLDKFLDDISSLELNIILVFGYGMKKIQKENLIDIKSIIDDQNHPCHYIDNSGTSVQIVPKDLAQLELIKKKLQNHNTFTVYTADNVANLPTKFYVEERFGPIHVIAKNDYAFKTFYDRFIDKTITEFYIPNLHHTTSSDNGIFIAAGKNIRKSGKVLTADISKFYSLCTSLLGYIPPNFFWIQHLKIPPTSINLPPISITKNQPKREFWSKKPPQDSINAPHTSVTDARLALPSMKGKHTVHSQKSPKNSLHELHTGNSDVRPPKSDKSRDPKISSDSVHSKSSVHSHLSTHSPRNSFHEPHTVNSGDMSPNNNENQDPTTSLHSIRPESAYSQPSQHSSENSFHSQTPRTVPDNSKHSTKSNKKWWHPMTILKAIHKNTFGKLFGKKNKKHEKILSHAIQS